MALNPSSYSKRVALLRRILLGAAVLAALALIGLSNLDRFGAQNGLLEAIRATGPAIANPDYQGRTTSGRAYRLTGESAAANEDGVSILRRPVLSVAGLAESPAVNIKADEARLSQGDEAVMQGAVRMQMSNGNRLSTEKLRSRLSDQSIAIPEPLVIDGPQMQMTADRLTGNLDSQIFMLDNVSITVKRAQP